MRYVRRVLVAILAAVMLLSMSLSFTAAKITSVDTGCVNNGHRYPPGQQPTCSGGGLTQESEYQNPHGFAPPGWNK